MSLQMLLQEQLSIRDYLVYNCHQHLQSLRQRALFLNFGKEKTTKSSYIRQEHLVLQMLD